MEVGWLSGTRMKITVSVPVCCAGERQAQSAVAHDRQGHAGAWGLCVSQRAWQATLFPASGPGAWHFWHRPTARQTRSTCAEETRRATACHPDVEIYPGQRCLSKCFLVLYVHLASNHLFFMLQCLCVSAVTMNIRWPQVWCIPIFKVWHKGEYHFRCGTVHMFVWKRHDCDFRFTFLVFIRNNFCSAVKMTTVGRQ